MKHKFKLFSIELQSFYHNQMYKIKRSVCGPYHGKALKHLGHLIRLGMVKGMIK